MPDTYAIAGFSDTSDPVILFESDSAAACDQWRTGYIRFGDWGGYDALALFEIAPDQSVDTIHLFDAPIDVLEKGGRVMYVYQSQSGHFEIAAYTSTRCPATRQRAAFAPSFDTRAAAESWRVEAERKIMAAAVAA